MSFDMCFDAILHVLSGVNDECWAYCITRTSLFSVKEQDAIQEQVRTLLSTAAS
jgi:hypothetical protein